MFEATNALFGSVRGPLADLDPEAAELTTAMILTEVAIASEAITLAALIGEANGVPTKEIDQGEVDPDTPSLADSTQGLADVIEGGKGGPPPPPPSSPPAPSARSDDYVDRIMQRASEQIAGCLKRVAVGTMSDVAGALAHVGNNDWLSPLKGLIGLGGRLLGAARDHLIALLRQQGAVQQLMPFFDILRGIVVPGGGIVGGVVAGPLASFLEADTVKSEVNDWLLQQQQTSPQEIARSLIAMGEIVKNHEKGTKWLPRATLIATVARPAGHATYTTVADYVTRAGRAGLGWSLPEGLDDGQLEARLFVSAGPPQTVRPLPDWTEIHREVRRPDVTLQLLHLEYKEQAPDGYQSSQFCLLHRRWQRHLDAVMRQEHRAGEKLFLDFAGRTLPIIDPQTGAITRAQLFGAVLGASNYTYAEVVPTQELLGTSPGSRPRCSSTRSPGTPPGRQAMTWLRENGASAEEATKIVATAQRDLREPTVVRPRHALDVRLEVLDGAARSSGRWSGGEALVHETLDRWRKRAARDRMRHGAWSGLGGPGQRTARPQPPRGRPRSPRTADRRDGRRPGPRADDANGVRPLFASDSQRARRAASAQFFATPARRVRTRCGPGAHRAEAPARSPLRTAPADRPPARTARQPATILGS